MIAALPGDSVERREHVTTQLAGTHLFEAARRGDRRARERLVAEHLAIVRSIALRYRNLGVSVDDLTQEGALGLLEAIDRYEPARSSDFESYARFRIRRAIRNALTEQSRLILYKGSMPLPRGANVLTRYAEIKLQAEEKFAARPIDDRPIPPGKSRPMAVYESLQKHFPAVYGIGDAALPPGSGPDRAALRARAT